MKNLKLRFLFLLMGSLAFISCNNDDSPVLRSVATDNPLVSEIDISINDNFSPYIEDTRHVGLSIAVLDDVSTNIYNYGETYKGNSVLPTEESIYEIGSNTKTFTATVATRLMLDAQISDETPISLLLPQNFPVMSYQGQEIKLKHLFNHTSGLPKVPHDVHLYDDFDILYPYENYGYGRLINFLNNYHLERLPGSEYEYSNLGYVLISAIVTYQSDVSIADNIDSILTSELGMYNTKMGINQIIDTNSNIMGAYHMDGTEGEYWNWHIWDAAGGLYSNLLDLEKYTRAHFDNYTANLKLKEAIDVTNEETYTNEVFGVGRAWHIVRPNGSEIINHAGGTGGFSTVLLIEPHQRKAIIVLANNANVTDQLQTIGLSFLEEFLN